MLLPVDLCRWLDTAIASGLCLDSMLPCLGMPPQDAHGVGELNCLYSSL